MHERSLVASLLRQVEAIRVEHHGRLVEEILVEIGPLAGVEPLLVQSAFLELAPLSSLIGAKLIIDNVPLTARCSTCGIVEVSLSRIVCSRCGATDVNIASGDEVRLKSVTIRDGGDSEDIR